MANDFFTSRAGADAPIAVAMARILREAGAKTFLQDEDFVHTDFICKMEEGAERSRVIALLSEPYLLLSHDGHPRSDREFRTVRS